MRIHSLTMTGIGPYAGREHIDFDAVGASGRFLLTGPTGSGKTTIIDAIVFALYGDVADSADSSKERIRSTLVGPHTESVIELVFSTGAGVYRVRRTPTYERAKRRGQGTTTQNGTVKLWHLAEVGGEPLDEPVTRVGDADAEIARAVGLSREQFTQTVVLPQGKFARFLRADSSERQHLLKDVFGTGIYDAIQDALIQASRDGARRVEQAAADLRGQVASLGRHPLLTEAPSPTKTADAGKETDDADQAVRPEDSSQEAPSGGTQEALPLPMDDADREEPETVDAGPAPTPAQALEAAMAGAAPDLVALRRVGAEVLEASRAYGANTWQQLFGVQIPLALPNIMAGINQTTMMALAMVVIASMIGATGLGQEVLQGINRLEVGRGLMAGVSIVVLAILFDRITQAYGRRQRQGAH